MEKVRRQKLFPPAYPFPCDNATSTGRSPIKPTSVHRLRPGDIDVIGAMGDSLVAGNGALEEYAIGTLIEYRGVSWCAGELIFLRFKFDLLSQCGNYKSLGETSRTFH